MLNATVGQLLVNEALPEDLRDYDRVLDKKELHRVLREVARNHPNKYREISFALNNLGRQGAQESGSFSFGVRHLKRSKAAKLIQSRIRAKLDRILARDDLTDEKRNELIVRAAGDEMKPQQEAILAEAIADKNPLALQVLSGTRGNKMNLASLLGSDLLYSDQRDNPLPIPVLRSYSEGLSPAEYWAGSYGARKGIAATKFATQDAGFLSKQLNQIAHRLVVTDKDYSDEGRRGIHRGLPIDVSDADSEGSLLAIETGPYKKNTVVTPKVRKHLKRLGKKKILIRSPVVGGSPSGGVYARDVGVRETGRLPGRGEQVGLQAVQALSEPLSQGQLSAKHSGGVAGEEKAVSGFQYINQLVQVPKTFKGGAAHTTEDGTVQRIEEAPAGGYHVTVNDKKHYVGENYELLVKKGDKVEAGDVISEGFPNPSLVTKYKGVGDGRKYFVKAFRDAMRGAGISAHRRNVELLSRGLINHVRLTEEYGDNVPDDVVPYSTLEHKWQPRDGHKNVKPKQAVGKYLEQPVLHYTIGTKVRPSMLRELKSFGIDEIDVHDQPPPFEPEMIRGMYSLQHDPDWLTRFYGSGLKKSLLSGVHRGAVSEERGTSFVPSISRSVDFGRTPGAIVRPPSRPYPMDEDTDTIKVAISRYTRGGATMGGYGEWDEQGNSLTFPGMKRDPNVYNQPNFSGTSRTPFSGQSGIFNSSAISPPSNSGTEMQQQQAQPQSAVPPRPSTSASAPAGLPKYDPSDRVKGYGSEGRQSQQPLPGLLGSPFGSQVLSQVQQMGGGTAGALALGAALDPNSARQAMSSITTDARLGGLSNAFYDAHGGTPGYDPEPTRNMWDSAGVTNNSGGGSWSSAATVPSETSAPPTPPAPEQPLAPGEGTGNSINPLSGNTAARGIVAAGTNKLLQRGGVEAAKQTAKQTVGKRIVQGVGRYVAPRIIPSAIGGGAGAATAAGGAAAAGGGTLAGIGAAVPLLPAIGGFSAINALTEGFDAAGLLPQWAGGTGFLAPKSWGGSGTDAFGYDHKGFEKDLQDSSYLGQTGSAIMNPVKSIHTILDAGASGIGSAATSAWDSVTGTDQYTRRAGQDKAQAASDLQAAEKQLAEANSVGTSSDRAHAEGNVRRQKAIMRDIDNQTQNWSYNKGFRSKVQNLMKDKGWGGREGAAGAAQAKFLQGMLKDYDENVWLLGEGDMRQNTRRKVKGLESHIRVLSEYNNGMGPDPKTQPDAYNQLMESRAKARALHQLNNQLMNTNTEMPLHLYQAKDRARIAEKRRAAAGR